MFKFRIIGFTLLMGLLGGIFFWRPYGWYLFLAAAPLMTALAVYECAKMLHDSGRKNFPAAAAGLFYITAMVMLFDRASTAVVVCGAVAGIGGGILLLMKKDELLEKLLVSGGVFMLLTPAMLGLLTSYNCTAGRAPVGAWLLFLCLATKATDTGGYIVGTLTAKLPGGNHKIAPLLSPKKSWEGLAGGMILSLTVGAIFAKFASYAPLWWYLSAAAVLSLGSFFGDLAESAVKRMCNVKDSGHWVPGMGGAFDVLDSFIFNGIVFPMLIVVLEMI